MSYSRAICNRIIEFLEKDDWKYRLDEEKEVIRSGLTLEGKMKRCDILFDLRDDKYLLYFTYPICADKAEFAEVVRLINLINYDIMFGNFEMDERDGEVRFRYAVDCDACLPSLAVVEHSMYRTAFTVNKYADAFVHVMMGFATAENAFKAAQNKD